MSIIGIVALVNNSISFSKDGENYIPHLNGIEFFPDKEKDNILLFRKNDKIIFSDFLKNIKDDSIIVIGENTYKDASKTIERYCGNKNITFFVSNNNEIKSFSLFANNWSQQVNNNEFDIRKYKKECKKSVLYRIVKKEMDLKMCNVYVLGGKSVYETFNYKYNKLIINQLNIKENSIKNIENNGFEFKKLRLFI